MITVFISSTIEDLHPERQAVKNALAELGLHPLLAEETMPAQSLPSKEACARAVASCDIYLLLLGAKFGYEFEPGLSVTRFEFETARRLQKPILVFYLEGEKEKKQQKFAQQVGDFKEGYFWRSIPEAGRLLRLEAEVRSAILNDYEMRMKALDLPEDERFSDVPWEFFIPRREIFKELLRLSKTPSARLLTLVGPGGIGKTALANELARRQMAAGSYPEGIYIIPCEAVQSAEILLSEFIRRFRLDEKEIKTPRQLAQYLRERRLLLILDNFETTLAGDPAGASAFLETLLRYSAAPRFLVTSRETCQVHGERTLEITPMTGPESRALFLKIAGDCNCRLSEADQKPLETLLKEMDGMPLAVALCAPQLQWLSAAALLAEWQKESTRLLSRPGRPAERLTSVDFSLNLSFKRLQDPAARLLFSLLSLFKGGAEEAALESIFQAPPARALAELRRRCLVFVQEGRVKLLEPVRRFAAQQWENQTVQAEYSGRFANYYAERVAQWEDDRFHNRGGAVLPLFKRETENIFSAAACLAEAENAGGLPQLTDLAVNAARLFAWAGLSRRGIELLNSGAAAALKTGNRSGEANCYSNLGELYFRISENERAREEFERALPLYREVGSKLGEANCYSNLGELYFLISENERAREEFERALPLYREVGSKLGEANCYSNLGELYFLISENERAREEFERALPLYREVGDKLGEANCYRNLGELYFLISENERAREEFERALPLYREVGSKLGEANCYRNLGELYFRISENERAREEFERALPL
ncbi:MAG: tetratricopeptide repeat protein, partial [Calditrichia bacterium]|nr:tetratricopeptide repeat protein [Calditrichia bacterium]